MDLRGAVCLVTGATGGIGRAIVSRLSRGGALLLVSGRDAGGLARVAAEVGAEPIPADLTADQEMDRLADQAKAVHGRVDVLINNAGAGWAGSFAEMPEDLVAGLLRLDLAAPIRLSRALLPGMLDRGRGHLVNVASIAGHVGVRDEAVYSAAKAGLIAFTESLRQEVRDRVGVSLVTPAVVDTPFFERRGRPYGRRRPRPVPSGAVAEAVLRAIRGNRAEVFVPGWMGLPARIRGAVPGVYRALARRFG